MFNTVAVTTVMASLSRLREATLKLLQVFVGIVLIYPVRHSGGDKNENSVTFFRSFYLTAFWMDFRKGFQVHI